MSREKQDNWKRTQLRMPFDQYDAILKYANQHNLSLNTAILDLADKGLSSNESNNLPSEIADKVAEKIADLLQKKAP